MKKSQKSGVISILGSVANIGEVYPEDKNLDDTQANKGQESSDDSDNKFKNVYSKLMTGVSSKALHAYLGFKDPNRRRREYLIPKDKAAWLNWMVSVAKKRVTIEYLTDKELKKVIIRARPNLTTYKPPKHPTSDPDVPPCIAWNEEQVGDWIASIGWPQLRETFVQNIITGRKLVLIDCSALNKMGMTDLPSMRTVAGKIRELLGIPKPSAMRPLICGAPYEIFLRRKVFTGRSYDDLTFRKFCENEGYDYELIIKDKTYIPCSTEVTTTLEHEDFGDGDSLRYAPTVEFLVRNALIRNKTVDQIMDDILESVFLPPNERRYGKDIWGQLKRGIGEGFDDLHLHYPQQKLEFASEVAHSLIEELYKTVYTLNDLNQLENHINENVTKEDMYIFRQCAQTLFEEALPLVGLLALGELELESVFRQEPEFQQEVRNIVKEAEKQTNRLVPDATAFVDDLISEALRRIPQLDLSLFKPDTRESLLKMSKNMLLHMSHISSATDSHGHMHGHGHGHHDHGTHSHKSHVGGHEHQSHSHHAGGHSEHRGTHGPEHHPSEHEQGGGET